MGTQTGSLYPTYATPRFCVDHILRNEGISALSGWTAAAGYPIDRMLDNQRGLAAKHNAAAAVTLKLTRELGAGRIPFDRVVIFGSNFNDNGVRVSLQKSDDDVTYVDIDHAIGGVGYGQAEYDLAPPHVIDWELAGAVGNRYVTLYTSGGIAGYTAPEIGELWLTRTLQPSTGVAHRWTNGVMPAVTAAETSAKIVTHSVDGEERARYAIGWDRLANGADLELLRYVKRTAGIRRNVLLYEHADFGTSPVVLDAFDDPASYPTGNLTFSDSPAGAPGANDDAVDCTSIASGFTNIQSYQDGEPLDLTDTVLEFWSHFDDATTIADAETSFYVRMGSAIAGDTLGTALHFHDVLSVNSSPDHWYKIAFDPATWAGVGALGSTISPADLTSVTFIHIASTASAAGNVRRHAKLYLRRKRQAPVPCYLTAYEEIQVGEAPSSAAGPLYNVTMQLEEALA